MTDTCMFSQQLLFLLSTGSVGEQLSNNPNLYISRDGGVTWEETLAGSWGVNLADHGGLMVAARDYHHDEESTELMYTCNEGYSWQSFNFTDVCVNTNVYVLQCIFTFIKQKNF